MRKRNPNNYRVPKASAQRIRDKQYIAFQKEPRLNLESTKMRQANEELRCDTIIGGKKVAVNKQTTRKNPNYNYRLLIIVGGERCEGKATRTFREDGKNVRRCHEHTKDEAWINTGEVKER